MLINKNKNAEQGNVVTIMLTTGAEVIGEIIETTDDTITLKKPLTLGANPQGGFGLAPAVMLGDPQGAVRYERRNILAWLTNQDQAEKGYRQYASGITIADSSVLKGGPK